jgi:hypothetical protein
VWIATTRGFYSAVQDRGNPSRILVRARNKKDIDNLKDLLPDSKPWKAKDSDYAWRLSCTVAEWAEVMAKLALEIDYPNFKDAVQKVSPQHASVYHRVWSVLLDLAPGGKPNYGTWTGYGGLYSDEKSKADRWAAEGMTASWIANELGYGVTTKMVRTYLNSAKKAPANGSKKKGKNRAAGDRTKPKAGAR